MLKGQILKLNLDWIYIWLKITQFMFPCSFCFYNIRNYSIFDWFCPPKAFLYITDSLIHLCIKHQEVDCADNKSKKCFSYLKEHTNWALLCLPKSVDPNCFDKFPTGELIFKDFLMPFLNHLLHLKNLKVFLVINYHI